MIQGNKGGESKSSRPPVESPDSLVSTSFAKVLDLVSEGDIEGLVNGQASVFLSETPLMKNGVSNFPGVQMIERKGTQDQSYIPGFPQSESETPVNVTVLFAAPVVRSVTNRELSAVRIRLRVPRLQQTDPTTGDISGTALPYRIELQTAGAAWQTVVEGNFVGKTAAGYDRTHRIELPPTAQGWLVRVSRLNVESSSQLKSDQLVFSALAEVIDAKFRYPNSAVIATNFDAAQFSEIPARAFHLRGRIINVPSNYDPVTRTYTGTWDGTFKKAYTNNPAWVYYDLMLHRRYGLGNVISASQVNKWELYRIGYYCDEMVSDGRGGVEPRFACNLYLQSRTDAYKVLQDIASIFRGMAFWAQNEAVVTADMPADPVKTFGNSDVIGGQFSYQGASGISRYNAALVTWNDMEDFCRTKVEYVEDRNEVAVQGKINKIEITAIGCTSQAAAQRMGRWALVTNALEAENISFTVGLTGAVVRPGQVITIADEWRQGRVAQGRVVSATTTSITVDRTPEAAVGDSVTVVLPNTISAQRVISAIQGNTISWALPLAAAPVPHASWALESQSLVMQKFRVLSVVEASGEYQFTITATKHVPGKYANIDNGTRIEQPPISVLPGKVQSPPTNVRLSSTYGIEQTMAVGTMTIAWDAAPDAAYYEVQWRKSDGNWIFNGRTGTTAVDIQGIYTGDYLARVMAFNSFDQGSLWVASALTPLQGKPDAPPAVTFLTLTGQTLAMRFDWGFPVGAGDTARTEIWTGLTNDPAAMTKMGDFAYPQNTHTLNPVAAGVRVYARARLVDRTGNIGPWSPVTSGLTENDGGIILDWIKGQVDESTIGKELNDRIDLIDGDGPGSVNERIDQAVQEFGDALAYDPEKTYVKGDMVRQGQRIYQAEGPVAAGVAPPADPWEDIGSILEQANALAGEVHQNTLDIAEVDGKLTVTSERVDGVYAQINPTYAGDTTTYAGDNTVSVGVWSVWSAVAEGDYAQGRRTDLVEAKVNQNAVAIAAETTARVNADGVLGQQITTVQTNLNGANLSIAQNTQAIQTVDGKVSATWSVRLQYTSATGEYKYAGVGLGLENGPGGLQSKFIIDADMFAIGQGGVVPFAVTGGQTFIKSAFIQDGTITNAKIGAFIQSDNYSPQATGWTWNKNGTMENNGTGDGYRVVQSNTYWRLYISTLTLPLVELGVLA